jgi:predicted amidohydrolase
VTRGGGGSTSLRRGRGGGVTARRARGFGGASAIATPQVRARSVYARASRRDEQRTAADVSSADLDFLFLILAFPFRFFLLHASFGLI